MRRQQTDSEGLVWWSIRRRQLGVRFRRQHPIDRYIVDFACLSHRLVVEIDGSQHDRARDADRDAVLAREGFLVMRFRAYDVFDDLDWVIEQISIELKLRDRTFPSVDPW